MSKTFVVAEFPQDKNLLQLSKLLLCPLNVVIKQIFPQKPVFCEGERSKETWHVMRPVKTKTWKLFKSVDDGARQMLLILYAQDY